MHTEGGMTAVSVYERLGYAMNFHWEELHTINQHASMLIKKPIKYHNVIFSQHDIRYIQCLTPAHNGIMHELT